MPLQLVILSRPFGWSALTQWPLLFQQQPHLQHQQIRSFFRRKTKKKRTNEKPRQRRSMMQRWNAKYRFFQANNELRMIPLRFRTHIGRILNKATRGEHQTEWLIHFVEEYMSYSVELRKTGIIPYIRENYHRVAFENFFLRILRLITFDNNGSGMNGFNFVIQFYADLLKVIYDKAAELKSLDSKVNLMRLRLSHFDKLKRVIRKEMAQYILKDFSSKPFPIAIPDRRRDSFIPKLITNNARKDTTTKLGRTHPINAVTTVEPNALDNETETTNNPCGEISPFVLGSIRRVYYKDLTARFIAKCERRSPMMKSKLLGTNKIVYGWYQTDQCTEPDVMVFTSLQEKIPTSIDEIFAEGKNTESSEKLKVATFYGILVMNKALAKIGLGEYMIRPIIQQLLDDPEIPLSVNQFSTLLPLYNFHDWLLNDAFEDDISLLVINDASDDFNTLMHEWECPKDQVFRRLKALLCRNYESYMETVRDKPIVAAAVDNLLRIAASNYLVRAKTPIVKWRCHPLETSTRYHVAHGASIRRINFAADRSEVGWEESFGIMANHLYDIHKLEYNQAKYNKKFNRIDIHDDVLCCIPKTRKLELNKEQREKWSQIDPVRKKILELSQNGKLFRVPLYGPPTFSRKKSLYLRLVPDRVPSSLIPPVVPKVGVSGLTMYVQRTTVKSKNAAIPSFVARTIPGIDQSIGYRRVPPNANVSSRRPSMASKWPTEVQFSLPLIPIPQGKMEPTKNASPRGSRKKTKT